MLGCRSLEIIWYTNGTLKALLMVLTVDDAYVGLGVHIEEFENVDVDSCPAGLLELKLRWWN